MSATDNEILTEEQKESLALFDDLSSQNPTEYSPTGAPKIVTPRQSSALLWMGTPLHPCKPGMPLGSTMFADATAKKKAFEIRNPGKTLPYGHRTWLLHALDIPYDKDTLDQEGAMSLWLTHSGGIHINQAVQLYLEHGIPPTKCCMFTKEKATAIITKMGDLLQARKDKKAEEVKFQKHDGMELDYEHDVVDPEDAVGAGAPPPITPAKGPANKRTNEGSTSGVANRPKRT